MSGLTERVSLPYETVATTWTPEGKEFVLQRGKRGFFIFVDGVLLMSSVYHQTELDHGTLGCAPIAGRHDASILIGGLGMGYTLRAVLDSVGPQARVTVAELVEAVGEWNAPGGELAGLCGCPVADPRARVVFRDVCELVREGHGSYDAILIDTDNETTALSSGGNDFLYTPEGLRAARRALRPGGILAFWFLRVGEEFLGMLGREGFSVTHHDIPSGEGTVHHAVIVAQAPGP